MLRINRQTDYAIRVALALAKKPAGTRVPTSDIRTEMLIPPAFLQRIVATLASARFIVTQPGRDGGIALARRPEEINLLQLVEAFEGPIVLSDCVADPRSCPFGFICPVNRRWERLCNLMRAELERATLAELVQDALLLEQAELQPVPVAV
ncbi:MAG: Rrf2 family transcriptional regulator [Chloroflexota bacterium]